MAVTMCPGQNTAFWRPEDIFEIICPACGDRVEFFKDDARRRCQGCGYVFANPKLNEGCAKWCQFAEKCLGLNPALAGRGAPAGGASAEGSVEGWEAEEAASSREDASVGAAADNGTDSGLDGEKA